MNVKRVLVIGITGGFGGAVADVLQRQGVELTALVRSKARALEAIPYGGMITLVEGDARDADAVREAARGVDVIVHGFNAPYERWQPEALEALEATCAAAVAERATILYPGNIYGLTPGLSDATEDAPRAAVSRKGALRNTMLERLKRASAEGAAVIVVRAGDYFGGRGTNTWFAHVVGPVLKGGDKLGWPTPQNVIHEWAYLPDVAETAVRLLGIHAEGFVERNAPGHVVTPVDFTRALEATLERPLRSRAMPWGLMGLARPFSAMVRELWDVRHVWTETVTLDGGRVKAELGEYPLTPFGEAVGRAVEDLTAAQRGRAV